MFCPKCGCQNADGARFCRSCGAQMSAGQGAGPGGPAYQRPVQANPPVLSAMKQIFTTPMALAAIIVCSASLLMSLISAFTAGSGVFGTLYSALSSLGLGSMAYQMYGTVRVISIITSLIGLVPAGFLVAGLWLIYVSAIDRNTRVIKQTGFTMARVGMIIQLAYTGLTLLLAEIVMIIALVDVNAYSSYYYGSAVGGAAALVVGVMVGLLIGYGVVIFYYIKGLQLVGVMQRAAASDTPTGPVSMFVIVMSFVLGGLSAIVGLASLTSSFLAGLTSLCSAGTSILFALFLLSYRAKVQAAGGGAPVVNRPVQPKPGGAAQPFQAPGANQPFQPAPVQPPQPAAPANQPPKPQTTMAEPQTQAGWNPPPPSQPASSAPGGGETEVLGQDRGTVLLTEPPVHYPTLVRISTGDTISVNQPVFRIGKEIGSVDYAITDNPAVSRSHANLIRQGMTMFVMDVGSKNHTYINGQQLQPQCSVEIHNGDHLLLANEEFIFNA